MQEKVSGRLQLPQAAARGHTGTRTAADHGKDVSRPDSGYRLHDIRTSEGRAGNIRVQNIAVFDQLAAALKNDALRRIEAKDVDIRFTIRDGRIATQPFDLSVGGISLNLSGSTGLDQTIDYTARVMLPEGSAGGILTAVDVGIGGSFSSPKITLDVKNAVKDAVSNAIGEKLGLSVGSSEGKSADEIRADAKAKHRAGGSGRDARGPA